MRDWNLFSETYEISRTKRINIEKLAQVEILSIEICSKCKITRILEVSKNGVHFCLQRHTETGAKVDRKRVRSFAGYRHLIVSRHWLRRKTAPKLTAEPNSTR